MKVAYAFKWRLKESELPEGKVRHGYHCFWNIRIQSVLTNLPPDNHMINGTKLLNVAGMTRGRRDGILKSEKTRHVVKIGPMHLKGVWYVVLLFFEIIFKLTVSGSRLSEH